MYPSLSKLLKEMQASAAKKLGLLENALNDDFAEQERVADQAEAMRSLRSFENDGSNALHPSVELIKFQNIQP